MINDRAESFLFLSHFPFALSFFFVPSLFKLEDSSVTQLLPCCVHSVFACETLQKFLDFLYVRWLRKIHKGMKLMLSCNLVSEGMEIVDTQILSLSSKDVLSSGDSK